MWDQIIFNGKTRDKSRTSSLRGASYAHSEVEILEEKIILWDRGLNDEGNSVEQKKMVTFLRN
ncbi:CpcT/CpeT family chromophore lyase [Winogradskyella sp.]|uniref:CpcT/CpeT family chromophore lyase n=1 Tax=Winogradskyella sp. TaxID=1883156 RepID=UPI003F696163